jgi:hypothetical protein
VVTNDEAAEEEKRRSDMWWYVCCHQYNKKLEEQLYSWCTNVGLNEHIKSDKLSDAYAKYYGPNEHLAVNEIIMLL